MRRTIDFKFICLSLLMAGAGMIVTACSNEDEDSVKQETRDGSEASNTGIVTDAVVLDADTLKVFEDYEVKFQLLNADNLPVTTFKDGENFTFQLTFINPGDKDVSLPIGIMDMFFFDIYTCDGTYIGRPYDAISYSGSGTTPIAPHSSVAFTCKAFGKKEFDFDPNFTPDDDFFPGIYLLKTEDKEPLPKGKYYTKFTLRYETVEKYEKDTDTYSIVERDSVVFKKEFSIE